jgi:GTP-binding protein EngB required for normal cell division
MTAISATQKLGSEETPSGNEEMQSAATMNSSQQTYLRVSCQHIDNLLSQIEEIVHSASSKSPFPRYILDLSPAQIRVVEDYIRRLRTQLVRALAWQNIDASKPTIPASRAITANLAFVDIALDELRPSSMRGSGSLAPEAALQLTGVVRELGALSEGLGNYMSRDLKSSLNARFDHLERAGHQLKLLRLVEEIVTRYGMVEFRPRLEALTSRLEDNNFEVALFGRVSSGKSSLLNRLLGVDLLPVGINPITAVPTRLQYGGTLRALVSYGTGRDEEVSISDFAGLVSERGNPGNLKNVMRALIEVPSDRLSEGIVLVDTPGLGSLARRGAAETLAYLPSCDLAVLLVDAGSTLNEEDVGTLRTIEEAGIPSLVLLSKSDLLSENDLRHATNYIREQLQRELHRDITIHPVSAMPSSSILLDRFFQAELLPRFQQGRSLRNESVNRKVEILKQTIVSSLRSRIGRQARHAVRNTGEFEKLEGALRDITGRVSQLGTSLDAKVTDLRQAGLSVVFEVADQAAHALRINNRSTLSSIELSEMMHDAVGRKIEPLTLAALAIGREAVMHLRQVANSLGRADVPDEKEVESLLRDMPRFEIATLPGDTNVGLWGAFGSSVLRFQMRNRLRRVILPLLKTELESYSSGLWQWMRQFSRRLELLISSYADGYRAQIQEMSGQSGEEGDVAKMKEDLEFLLHPTDSDSEQTKEVAQQIGA